MEQTNSKMIPDFGPLADKAILEVLSLFPETFSLKNHDGKFRISRRASFVSRGEVMLYLQRLWTNEEFVKYYGKEPFTPDDLWGDFAKGTVTELSLQVKRV
jgi:hypothetical protein